jgi:hypothetical protein
MSEAMLNALGSLVSGDVRVRIRATFDMMGIAEEEIADAMRAARTRWVRARLDASFGVLTPPPAMVGKASALYVYHVREMLARVASGADTRPGTDAEVLVGLLAASVVAPLDGTGTMLAEKLFRRVFPDAERVLGPGTGTHETYPGEMAARLEEARRVCRVDDRLLRDERVHKLAKVRRKRAKEKRRGPLARTPDMA